MASLWAVMELFCFLRMGGTVASVTVLPLLAEEDVAISTPPAPHWTGRTAQHRAAERVLPSVATFEVCNARCEREDDRQRLLACVESGFGSHEPFNKLIVSVLSRIHIDAQPPPTAIQAVRILGRWRAISKGRVGREELSIPWVRRQRAWSSPSKHTPVKHSAKVHPSSQVVLAPPSCNPTSVLELVARGSSPNLRVEAPLEGPGDVNAEPRTALAMVLLPGLRLLRLLVSVFPLSSSHPNRDDRSVSSGTRSGTSAP